MSTLKSASVLFCLSFFASHACAEIFKCAGRGGLDVLQNFPCEFESLDSMPQSAGPVNAIANAKAIAAAPAAVAHKSTPTRSEPRIGMTTDEVRRLWGEPTDTVSEEPGEGSRFEVWSYGNSRSVRFDHKGRVSAIQQ